MTGQATCPATILVVDDDPDVREMIADYLLSQGYGVAEAGDAETMRAVLGQRTVDLVLLDRTMPDGDGRRGGTGSRP